MNSNTRQRIQWSEEEKESVFKKIDNYLKINQDFPCSNNLVAFERFQSGLAVHRRKKLGTYSSVHVLKNQYFDYVSKQNKQATTVKKEKTHQEHTKHVLTPEVTRTYEPRLNDVTFEQFSELIDTKFVTLYESIKGVIEDSNKNLPKLLVDSIMSSGSQEKSIEKIVKPDVKVSFVAPEVVVPEVHHKIFTEDEIRAIIREEIESLFGPIKAEPKPITHPEKVNKVVHHVDGNIFNNSPENIKVAPAKEKLTILVGDDYRVVPVEKTSKYVYVCGLNSNQLQNLKKYFNHEKQIIIDGSENYNHDVKTKAKHADLVLVSKFSSHSTYETLKSSCTESEFDFVSGGMTMIKNRIRSFLNQHSK